MVQSYLAISKAVQTMQCEANLLNPDKYFVKLLAIKFCLKRYFRFFSNCSVDAVQQSLTFVPPLTLLNRGEGALLGPIFFQKTSKIIIQILISNLNYLMEVGKFPDEQKLGKITPIYKKDSDELFENYRPVSTLPIFGKIFEKIIFS